ncbi:hypothetical protein BRD17_00480 [Halobacteriales archaeon SW_7_68_16]|nr:MAG: hypothetical protein BRD17_00480 [Halobacteriales archaeon SW_7_68_16]
MGLFERVGGLLAGSDDWQNGRGGSTPGGGRDAAGSHGSHWDAIVEDDGEIRAIVAGTLEDGTGIESPREGVVGYRSGPTACGACVVVVDDTIVTAFPDVAGTRHDATLTGVDEWDSGVEAQLELALDDGVLSAFDVRQFARRSHAVDPGTDVTVLLAALCYRLEPTTAIADDGDELVPPEDGIGCFPFEGGAADDYLFRTVLSSVETHTFAGRTVHRVDAPLFRSETGEEVVVPFYAADHVVEGGAPNAGDDVTGVLWLQGRPVSGSSDGPTTR